MQQHDTRGLDPRLIFTAKARGTYFVRVFAFPAQPDSSINFAGGDNYLYRLTLTTGGFVDHSMPLAIIRDSASEMTLVGWNLQQATVRLEPSACDWRNNWLWFPPDVAGLVPLRVVDHQVQLVSPSASRQTPQHVPIPVTLTGQLQSPRGEDVFSITAAKAKPLEISVDSTSLGYDMDPVVSVIDASGKILADEDDGRRNTRDPSLTFSPPADGPYQVVVRDLHRRSGMRMVYVCTIAEPRPVCSLSVAAGTFRITPGLTLEIPVSISRQGGFKEELEISAANLPAGVTAEGVRSPGDGDASKSVKLVLKAAAESQSGPFRIVAKTVAAAAPQELTATFETTHGSMKQAHRELWMSVK